MVEAEKMTGVIQPSNLPPKKTDPGVFTLPISIRDVPMERAMCDLGASINIMPHSMYKKLGEPKLAETDLEIQLADGSCIYPEGVLENEIVKVSKFMYLADFFVIKMAEPEAEESVGILLGRPFLSTAGTVIDVRHGIINLEFNKERLTIDINKAPLKPQGRESIQSVEAVRSLKQENLEEKLLVDSTNNKELKREAADWFEATMNWEMDERAVERAIMEFCQPSQPARSKEIIQSKQIAKPLDQAASSSIQLRKNPSPTEQLLPLSGSPVATKSLTSQTYHEHVKPNLRGQKGQSRKKLRPGEEGVEWKTADLMKNNPKLHMPPAIVKKEMIDPTLRRKDFMMGQEKLLFQCQHKLIPKKRNPNWADLRTVTAKRTQVAKLPYSTDQEGIRALLGRAGVYSKFFKEFTKRPQLPTKFPRNDEKFEFSAACKAASPFLKNQLISFQIIRAPDWNQPFEVICEASNCAVGAVLRQKIQGKNYVVLYASKTLSQAQRNYDVTKKEMLSVVLAFGKFRRYLHGSKVRVYTNPAAIKDLSAKKRSNPHVIRWLLLLQEFEWEAVDREKSEHGKADHLGRVLQEDSGEAIPVVFPNERLYLINSISERQWTCQEEGINQAKQGSWKRHAQKKAIFAGRTDYSVANGSPVKDGVETIVVEDIPPHIPDSRQ